MGDNVDNVLDKLARVKNLKDGEEISVYDGPPGIFGRTFQVPKETIKKEGNRIVTRTGFGGVLSDVVEEAIIKGNDVEVYRGNPGLFGRLAQTPEMTIETRAEEVNIYDGLKGPFSNPKRTYKI